MKKIILAALMLPLAALAQTFPTPTFNSLTLQNPLTVANGGTGSTSATGTGAAVLSNSPTLVAPNLGAPSAVTLTNGTGLPISTGVSGLGTGVATALGNVVTGSGSPVLATSPMIANATVTGAFTATGLVTTTDLAAQAANTVIANVTGASASPTAFAMPSCSTSSSALQWSSGTGFACNTSINAATLGGATFAAPGPIGSTTASTGAFTTLSASGTVSGAGFTSLLSTYAPLASPAFTGTPTAPTATAGTNSTRVATTAFVAQHAPCLSIMDFGGNNSGTADNAAAFNATVAAGLTGQTCIYFPPGNYLFTSSVGVVLSGTGSSVTIKGAGAEDTVLNFTGSSQGIFINYSSYGNTARVRDLTFATNAAGSSIGLTLNQTGTSNFGTVPAMSDVSNVVFRGSDGFQAANYWGTAVVVNGVSNVNFISDGFWGASAISGFGIHFLGSGSIFPVQENVFGGVFSGLADGIVYDTNTQGLSVSASNFTNVSNGIFVPSGIAGTSQLTVTGSQFNCLSVCIFEQTGVDSTIIQGNLFFIGQAANGIFLSPASSSLISGNAFVPRASGETANAGVTFNGWKAFSSVVTGNQCSGLITCINLATGSKFVNVQSNSYSGNTNNVINNGTSNTVGVATP